MVNLPDDASLFVDNRSAGDATPGVHAFVVGVSSYPRGPWSLDNPFSQLKGFEDIPGTALGAASFAKFLKLRFRDPADVPLQTIRLLLSPVADEELTLDGQWCDATRDN